MRCKIVCDEPGRLRVRFGRGAFSAAQGYGIESLLLACPYALSARATPVNGGLLIRYKPGERARIWAIIAALDRKNLPESAPRDENHMRELDDEFLLSLARIAAWHFFKKLLVPAPVNAALTLLRAAQFWRRGLRALGSGRINVNVLDASAILTAAVRRDFSSAAAIMLLLRVPELLEDYTRKRARQSLTQSLALNIDTVWRVTDGEPARVPLKDIQIGECIRVHAGGIIPLDGEVARGEALVNESTMTGEPHGVRRSAGDSVFAGTAVEEGTIDVRVRTFADGTRIQSIISLIDSSESLKAALQSKAERLADSIVPYSFVAAAAVWLLTGNPVKASSVLMVDYSCAIKLTTPICIISAMHGAAKRRILVKGGKYLEAFALADTIIFDKTGTLTAACPSVAKVITFGGRGRSEMLKIAACLEEHFPHSVAKAIVRQAENENLQHREEHAEPEYIVAHGISSMLHGQRVLIGSRHFIETDEKIEFSAQNERKIRAESDGFSTVFLAIGGELAAMLCIDDPVRAEAAQTVAELRALGLTHVVMLTGDSEAAARAACEKLGITEYYSGVLPEGKAEIIRELKDAGRTVIMVGDGINDSPALALADVSVAMKDGSDIAKQVADISLMAENLSGLVTLRGLSQRLLADIHGNYRAIIAINSCLLLSGVAGLLQPSTSALLHNVSTMLLCAKAMSPPNEAASDAKACKSGGLTGPE